MSEKPCKLRTKKEVSSFPCPMPSEDSHAHLLFLSKVEDSFPPKNNPSHSLLYCSSIFHCLLTLDGREEEERSRENMKDSSKVIMGATLVMVVSLAIVLGLVLVLLVELYCSLLLRRRRLRNTTPIATANTINTTSLSPSPSPSQALRAQGGSPSPLSSFYAQGVLDAPRTFLFPALSSKQNDVEIKNQSMKLHSVLEIQTQASNMSNHHMGIISPASPSTSLVTSPQPLQETPIHVGTNNACNNDAVYGASAGVGNCKEHFMYISNPIYDNDASRLMSRADTPFETPDTSPSRLDADSSSGEDETAKASPSSQQSLPVTPPLTPMKKLPAEACSVSLRDARSLGTSGSDTVSNNGLSSSSSGSPSTSPSW